MFIDKDDMSKYIETVIRKNTVEGGLRAHSINKLLLSWFVSVGLGVFALAIECSRITIALFVVSILLLLCAVRLFKKKNYSWFLYHTYIISSITLCAIDALVVSSLTENKHRIVIIAVAVIFVSTCVGVILSYIDIYIKVATNWDGSTNNGCAIIMLCFVWIVSNVIIQLISENMLMICFASTASCLMGLFNTTFITIYYYGNKHDPKCEIMKRIQSKKNHDDNSNKD